MAELPAEGAIALIDKPAGITSHDVVLRARRALPAAKIGHAGTLDPFASGLLILLIGRATKAQQELMCLPKRYEVIARLGALSSTGDPEGELRHTGRIPARDRPLPLGEIMQRPPAYSAIKVGGERAYRRARRGERFELPPRPVTIHSFEELWRDEGSCAPDGGPPRAAFRIECSSGTYVRALIADLGDAYCETLRRTAIGPFTLDQAQSPPSPTLPGSLRLMALGEARARVRAQ
ncbi:MAG TPA: tRNA pseudouridine(55) synthase TruB [Solirubrobacteraceae bacterium]|nr:tRNA pseudouridine(55) synthase TruB [Solirubrobacteraceae bacterium]